MKQSFHRNFPLFLVLHKNLRSSTHMKSLQFADDNGKGGMVACTLDVIIGELPRFSFPTSFRGILIDFS